MNKENKNKLYSSFPDLYKRLKEGRFDYFTCYDGWFDLLWRISEHVTKTAAKMKLNPKVVQIKEKFGELRFYLVGGNPELNQSVRKLCEESQHICERCGQPGSFWVAAGYWCVRCPACLSIDTERYRQEFGRERIWMTPEAWKAQQSGRFSDDDSGE